MVTSKTTKTKATKKKKTPVVGADAGAAPTKTKTKKKSKDVGSKKKKSSPHPTIPPQSSSKRQMNRDADEDDDDDDGHGHDDPTERSSHSQQQQQHKQTPLQEEKPSSSTPTSDRPSIDVSGSPPGGRGSGRGVPHPYHPGRADGGRGRGPGPAPGRGPGPGRGRGREGRGGRGRGRGRAGGRSMQPGVHAGQQHNAGSRMMMAPVPSTWTTASGHFKPQESELGFDASSAVGPNGATFSRKGRGSTSMLGLGDNYRSSGSSPGPNLTKKAVEIQVEIEDPEEREAFYKGLDKMGIQATIDVADDFSERNPVSVVSMGYASYILDLAQQREMREKDRQEEALEEALELYKTALSEGAKDDEKLFLAILSEIKKELDEKYVEVYKKKDEWLDEALQAELDRRAALKNEPKEEASYQQSEEMLPESSTKKLDGSKRSTRVDEIIESTRWDGHKNDVGNWEECENEYEDYYQDIQGDEEEEDWDETHVKDASSRSNRKVSSKDKNSPRPSEKTTGGGGGGFLCCGKAVEDSVLITNGPSPARPSRDHSQNNFSALFKSLKKKKEEEEKKQRHEELLVEEDMWWKNEPVEVNVPEIEDDAPLPLIARAGSYLGLSKGNSFLGLTRKNSIRDRSHSERGSCSSSMDRSFSDRGSRTSSFVSQREASRRRSRSSKASSEDSRSLEDRPPTKDKSHSTRDSAVSADSPKKTSDVVPKKKTKSKIEDSVLSQDAECLLSDESASEKPKIKSKKQEAKKNSQPISQPNSDDVHVVGTEKKSNSSKPKVQKKGKHKATKDSKDAHRVVEDGESSPKSTSSKKKKATVTKKKKRPTSLA